MAGLDGPPAWPSRAPVLPEALRRSSGYLDHPVFHEHRSETAMLRYLRRLADFDIALDRSMIPLGSCTMKLNAAAEMEAVSWPEFAGLHPFAPAGQAAGYTELITDLERWLAEITGYDAVSVQPNAGSQGELAGLLAIRAYHSARGDAGRDICLIPESAHGTNAASAVLAGLRVVVVKCGGRRRHRRRRPGRQAGGPRPPGGRDHADLPVHQRRVRGGRAGGVRGGARRGRPGLRGRGQPERAGRAGPAGPVRRRRVAPQPAQDVLHPARRRRPRGRPGGGPGAPRPVPARARVGPGGRGARTGRRASCPSPGPTSG